MYKFLEQINLLYRSFGIHLKGSSSEHHFIDEVIKALRSESPFFAPAGWQTFSPALKREGLFKVQRV